MKNVNRTDTLDNEIPLSNYQTYNALKIFLDTINEYMEKSIQYIFDILEEN